MITILPYRLRRWAGNWRLLPVVCLLLVGISWGQTSQTPTSPKTPQGAVPAPQEQKISPKEAEELFRSVDEILQFASKDTELPIEHPVKRQLVGRDQVVTYLQKNMSEDKDAKRLKRSELVLKKFGLLPRDFDLQSFLVALLREQVAGYYDPKTKTVNLLDWLDAEQQKPVLAHELTHALQDQSFNLEKWMKAGDKDLDEIKDPTPEDFESEEIGKAREGVVEGQAMVTLVDYMLAPLGKSMLTSPELTEVLKKGMVEGTADSPEFKNAPIFLQEMLTFPYRYGLDFEAALLENGGKEKAFSGVFKNPPLNTRQIMEPKSYLSGERIDPMQLPDFKHDFKDYERFDIGAMGEFDVSVLVDQYASREVSGKIYPQWRGGYYYAVRPKADAAAPLGLLYFSRWADGESASKFAAIYAKSLVQRYKQVHGVQKDDEKAIDLQTLVLLKGLHSWLTEEGTVQICVDNNEVLVVESLDQPTVDRLRQELLPNAVAN
jgi:hypothetical protein